MDPVTPRSGWRRRRILRGLAGIVAFVAIVLSCIEIAYQLELAHMPSVSNRALAQGLLPPLVIRSAAVQLFDTVNPQMRPIYPWTPFIAIARAVHGERPRLTLEAAAAGALVMRCWPGLDAEAIWRGIDVGVAATWISRHLSTDEAISLALTEMSFAAGDRLGLAVGAMDGLARHFFGKSLLDVDAEEIAELLIMLSRHPSTLRNPVAFREARDELLRKLHSHGVIDEPTMLATMQRDVRRIK